MRRFRPVGFALLFSLLCAGPARADWNWGDVYDWLEGLSGPGPFRGAAAPALTGLCIGAETLIGTDKAQYQHKTKPCFFLDRHQLSADPDARFGKVDLTYWDAGASFQLTRTLEVGVGVGVMHFDSEGVTRNRFTVTPVRVVAKPLYYLLPPRFDDFQWPGVLKAYAKEIIITGRTTGADFNRPPDVIAETAEVVLAYGLIVDLTELIGW